MNTTRYRKRPVEIEAVQLTDDADWDAIGQWCGASPRQLHEPGDLKDQIAVPTFDGDIAWASVGDWIVRGSEGEFYPVKREVFEATYEPVRSP